MADQTIDRLQIEIQAKSVNASDGIDKLAQSIQNLKSAIGSGTNELSGISASLAALKSAVAGTSTSANNVTKLASALQGLQNVQLGGLQDKVEHIKTSVTGFADLGNSLSSIKDFGKGMTSLTSSLKRISTADLTGTADKVRDMVQALRPLTDEMLRAGPAAASYGAGMRDMAQAMRTANNAGKLTYSLTESTKRLNSTMQGLSFAKFAAGFYMLKRAGDVIGGFIQNINSYVEDINLFTVAMGDSAGEASKLADQMQVLLGIDAGEAKRSMGIFNQMTTSFGVSGKQAAVLSENLTQLIYDLSSYYNIDTESAFEKLRSGLAGETEPLRQLGIDVSSARLQQELFKLGIDQNVESLGQADKALLRYNAVMAQTTNAQTDMARTLSSPANQLRVLEAQLNLASRAIGSIFIPALTAALPYVIAFVKVIGEAASALAAFLGFEMPKFDYSGIQNAGTSVGDLSNNMSDLAGNAASAKKQMNMLISGFDELNIMQKKTDASGSAGTGGIGSILGDMEVPKYDMFEGLVGNQVDKIVDDLKDKLTDILPYIESIGTGLAAWIVTSNFLTALSKVKDYLKELSKAQKIAIGVAFVVSGITLMVENIKAILEGKYKNASLDSFIKTALSGILIGLGLVVAGLGAWAIPVAVVLTFAITDVIVNWENVKGMFSGIWDAMKGIATLDAGKVTDGIETFFTNFFTQDSWANKLPMMVADAIFGEGTSTKALENFKKEGWLGRMFDQAKSTVQEKAAEIKTNLETAITEAWNNVVSFFTTAVPLWWNENVAPWFTLEKWQKLFYNIGFAMGEAVRSMFLFWNVEVPKWLYENVRPLFSIETWQEIFSSIWISITDAVKKFRENWLTPINAWLENDVKPWFKLSTWLKLFSSIHESMKKTIDDFKATWGEKISDWYENDVKKWFSWKKWLDLGKTAVDALFEGMKNSFGAIASFIQGFFDGLSGRGGYSTNLPDVEAYRNENLNWYAKGGVFNKPSIIGVGERGSEAVVPLSKNADWMNTISDRIAESQRETATNSLNFTEQMTEANTPLAETIVQVAYMIIEAIHENATEVTADSDAMFKVVKKKAHDYKRTTGHPAF